jgi:hypothetical protein
VILVVQEVMIRGQVTIVDTEPSLIPSVPDGVEGRTDCAVKIRGTHLPAIGDHVTVHGSLNGQEITVIDWEYQNRQHFSWEERSQSTGVDQATLQEIRDSRPKEWEIVSIGAARTAAGKKVLTLHVVRATPEVSDWVARQPKGSVIVYSFIRDPGLGEILLA